MFAADGVFSSFLTFINLFIKFGMQCNLVGKTSV